MAFLISSCSRQGDGKPELRPADNAPGPDAILAVVGGKSITVGDFESEMSRRARSSGIHYATESQKRALLDEMIQFNVLLQRATAAGYDHNPEVLTRLDQLIVGKFKEDHLATNNESSTTVSDEDMRGVYQQNQEHYATPESVHLAIVYFKSSPKATPEKRSQAKEHAEAVLQQALQADEAGFQKLAQRYSDDQVTRYSGGDIGWLARGEGSERWGNSFAAAAFAIRDAGDCAPLVETPQGFYIIRLIGKKPAGVRPFEEVKDAIAYQVARERQQERQIDFLKEMKKGLKIETYPQLLDNISAPARVSDQAPPALPRG